MLTTQPRVFWTRLRAAGAAHWPPPNRDPPDARHAERRGGSDGGHGAWPWPVLGEVITPYKNGSDRYAAGQHRGLDIAAPVGTQVRAIVDGRVSASPGALPDGGVTVTVRSSDGAYLVSASAPGRRARVARGDPVSAGETLGAVGTTGKRSSTQPHLHLSVRRASDRAYLDPMTSARPAARRAVAAERKPKAQAHCEQLGAQSTERVHAQQAETHVDPLRHGARSQPYSRLRWRRRARSAARIGRPLDLAWCPAIG